MSCKSFANECYVSSPNITPNNGMHPTANSAALIRKTWMLDASNARRVMPGVRHASRHRGQPGLRAERLAKAHLTLNGRIGGRSNNGMHPTANSAALIRKT